MAEGAKDFAKHAAYRKAYRFARSKLPRPIFKLLFSGKSADEVAEDEIKLQVSKFLFGCGISLALAFLFAAALLFVLGIVAFGILSN